ncbi:MAG: EutN/CcmL family microcompartment protein [Luteolibacter sp.]
MRVAQVIGRVTLSIQDAAFKGGRWLVVNPLDAAQYNDACNKAPAITAQPSLITYDSLGAGEGDIVGIVEGAEATAPFDFPIAIDAITVAIFDSLSYQPPLPN